MPPLSKEIPGFSEGFHPAFLADPPGLPRGIRRDTGLFSNAGNAMLGFMEPKETAGLAREAESKLAKGGELSREERLALLAKLIAGQETRKERRYGQN
jgi:hypothetical protein